MLCVFFCIAWVAAAVVGAVDYADPHVFNAYFYINTNVQVLHAGVRTASAARTHWLSHGIDMGLQAAGNFHSKQYLARYPDLTAAFGATGYRHAVEHYIDNGLHENRLGYVEGGNGERWTVSDSQHKLFVSASQRMGAAVDSVVWNNKEFINAWDHGRELQLAMNFPPNGECFNPTEAGGRDDSQNADTHTVVQGVHAEGNKLDTTVLPAYWLQAGHHISAPSGDKCQVGMAALNTENTYQHAFSKSVVLTCPGVSTSCMQFLSEFRVGGNIPPYQVLQMEAPTGYLTGEFTEFRSYDHRSNHLIGYEGQHPLVVSTPDQQYAMGVYAPPHQDTDEIMYYGKFQFPSGTYPAATNKWNLVFRKHPFAAGSSHDLHYTCYICVGTVNDVTSCIRALMEHHSDPLIG